MASKKKGAMKGCSIKNGCKSEKVGKFGRVLGKLHVVIEEKECCVNDKLIEMGHAVEYHGGKRK